MTSNIGFITEGNIDSLGHVVGALHLLGNGPPVSLGGGLHETVLALAQASVDGEADLLLATGPGRGMDDIEAAFGPSTLVV